jgi:DNA-binding beta-propeller fold protein YncE
MKTWIATLLAAGLAGLGATPAAAQYVQSRVEDSTFKFYTWTRPAVTPDGRWLFIANIDRDQVVRVDPQTRARKELDAGDRPANAYVSPDGSLLAVVNVGNPGTAGDTVSLFDLREPDDTEPEFTFAPNGNFDYYNNIAFSRDLRFAFIASRYADELLVFDPWNGALVSRHGVGPDPTRVAVTPDGRYLAVVVNASGAVRIQVYDLEQYLTDGSWVLHWDIATQAVQPEYAGLAFSGDGRMVYIPAFSQAKVQVFDLRDKTEEDPLYTGGGPTQIAVDPDFRKAYTLNVSANSLSVLDLVTTHTHSVTFSGVTLTYNSRLATVPGTGYGFITASANDRLVRFDAVTGDRLESLTTADGPGCLAMDRDGRIVAVTNEADESIELLVAPRVLGLPRVESGAASNLGFSLLNTEAAASTATLDAYSGTGGAGGDPVPVELPAGSQFVREWTSPDLGLPAPFDGWLRMTTPLHNARGFSMFYAADLTWMDGLTFGAPPLRESALPLVDIGPDSLCRLHLVNPNASPAQVTLTYRSNTRPAPVTRDLEVAADGRAVIDDAGLFFGVAGPERGYVTLSASLSLWALVEFGRGNARACLPAGPPAPGGRSLILAHTAEGGGWRSSVVLDNLSGNIIHLNGRMYSETGAIMGNAVLNIYPYQQYSADVHTLFNQPAPAELKSGWIEIWGETGVVHGAIAFETEDGELLAALPAQTAPQRDIYFSHVAQDDQYFTGLALVNNSGAETKFWIYVYNSAGQRVAELLETPILNRVKFTRLLSDPLIGVNLQLGGYIHVEADRPVFAYSLFGRPQFLSAIPAQ